MIVDYHPPTTQGADGYQQIVRPEVGHERGWNFAQTPQRVVEYGRAVHTGRVKH